MTDNNTARFSSANQSSWQKRRKMTVSFVLVLLKPTLALRSQSKSLTRPHPFQYVVPLSRNNDVILLHTCSQLKTHSCVLQDGDRPSSVGSFSVRCSRRFCRAESNSTPTPTLTRLDFIPTNRSQLMLSILYSYVLLLVGNSQCCCWWRIQKSLLSNFQRDYPLRKLCISTRRTKIE